MRVRSSAVRLAPRRDRVYVPFLVAASEPLDIDVDDDVEVVTAPPPPPAGRRIFEGGELWSVYEDGLGYRLVFDWGAPELGVTVVRCSADTSEVTAHVRPVWPGVDGDDPIRYPLDKLLLMGHLALRGGVLVHSAGLVTPGAGLVFAGASGTGKTTLCRLLAAAGLGEGLLSDERTVVREEVDLAVVGASAGTASGASAGPDAAGQGVPAGSSAAAPSAGSSAAATAGFRVWGTPWPSDAGIARNESAPLRALLFLVQDAVSRVVPLTPAAAVQRLLPLVTCPWYDRRLMPAVLDTCGRLVESVPCYEFHFARDGGAVAAVRRFVAGPA